MSYSFYDWNNALQQRNEYVEERLKDGSPIVAVAFAGGILMVTLRRQQQRKLFEVYDRLMMGALGKQSDVESLRLAAIESAHREGFERSPDDVSIQRLVGFGLSPAVKRVYNDQQSIPLTLRAVFAEIGRIPEADHLFVLGYDGEFRTVASGAGVAVAAGTPFAEEQAEASVRECETAPVTLTEALTVALNAWGIGRARLAPEPEKSDTADDDYDPLSDKESGMSLSASRDPAVAIREALKDGATLEACLLQRDTPRETKFRLLKESETQEALSAFR